MRIRPPAIPAFAVAGALVFAACGGDDDSADPTVETLPPVATSPAAPTSPASAETVAATSEDSAESAAAPAADFNDADVTFAQGMIPHHEQAIEMADIALDPTVGASDAVRDVATRIQKAQDPEIESMTAWLTAWGQPVTMDTSGGQDMSSMEGVMSSDEMDALGATTGTEFDTMWLEMMIRHHEGAIAMAQTVKANGSNPDVLALADQIIAGQQAQISEMQELLEG